MGAGAASWDCRGARAEGGNSHRDADQERSIPKNTNLNQAEMLLCFPKGICQDLPTWES